MKKMLQLLRLKLIEIKRREIFIYKPSLPADSANYEILFSAASSLAGVEGFTCEIGLRRGGGTTAIAEGFLSAKDKRIHVAIDPYGNIEYECAEGKKVRLDYTNKMKIQALPQIYSWFKDRDLEFLFFNMEDTEFFKRYSDGIPVYQQHKKIINKYALVHFDGPHAVEPLLAEIAFFAERTPIGGYWIFDDIKTYDHQVIDNKVCEVGFGLCAKSPRKMSYKRIS